MASTQRWEIRHYTAPLPDSVAHDLIVFLKHKGPPWVDDIRQRVRGEWVGAEDHYYVAIDNDRVVGHAWYTISQTDPRLGLVGHVFTSADLRRKGISRQLLEAAMAEFCQRGGIIMQLFTSTPFSVQFYEQLGFENLFTQTVYHDQDWYMRYPIGADEHLHDWFATIKPSVRTLTPGDLPQYCLLYNAQHDLMLKDRAQQIGFGLEAELAFIDACQAVHQKRAACFVLDNGQTLVGAASLFGTAFPHQSHIGIFDIYTLSQARSCAARLAEQCLQARDALGIQRVYAIGVDALKCDLFRRLGFVSRSVLSDHYRAGTEYYDCTLFELVPNGIQANS